MPEHYPENVFKCLNVYKVCNSSPFKSVIRDYHFTALANTYDCDDARSFKTICPKCNKARTLANSIDCCFQTLHFSA